jgi:hypothetical protein
MTYYILGIITGILLVLAVLVAEGRNRSRYKPSKLVETIQTSVNRGQRGEVILPKDEATETREKMIKEKHDAGLDVFLDDL